MLATGHSLTRPQCHQHGLQGRLVQDSVNKFNLGVKPRLYKVFHKIVKAVSLEPQVVAIPHFPRVYDRHHLVMQEYVRIKRYVTENQRAAGWS